jgi:hypothetical protein
VTTALLFDLPGKAFLLKHITLRLLAFAAFDRRPRKRARQYERSIQTDGLGRRRQRHGAFGRAYIQQTTKVPGPPPPLRSQPTDRTRTPTRVSPLVHEPSTVVN